MAESTPGSPTMPTIVVQPPAARSSGWIWIAAVAGFLLLGAMGTIFFLIIALTVDMDAATQGPDRMIEKEIRAATGSTTDKIAVLTVEGVITDTRSFDLLSGEAPSAVDLVRTFLEQAREDDQVAGVLLQINSPGGGVTASDLIHREIARYREETQKPVVALMLDLAASGGYYIAAACDSIVAHRTTLTGSIGVILSVYDFTGLGDKVGVRQVSITSGANKDIGSPFHEMTEEERTILQGTVDRMFERFVEVVVDGRPDLTEEKIRELADGRIYTGGQAAELGLVDRLGYFDDAIDEIKSLASISDARIVTYRRQPGLVDILSGNVRSPRLPAGGIEIDVIDLERDPTPRLEYRWRLP